MRLAILAPTLALRAGLRAIVTNSQHWSSNLVGPPEVAAEAASLEDYISFAPHVDLILIDGQLLERRALETLSAAEGGPLSLLVLSDSPHHARLLVDLPLRAWGMLSADTSASELQAAVYAISEGLWVGDPSVIEPIFSHISLSGETIQGDEPETLTERECQVLQQMALGLANKQIAGELKISEHTVKFHISSIFAKLGAASRTEAVRIGIQRGLISI